MIRVVFDVNVIISALLFANSVPRRAFDRALSQGTILISDALSEELRRVLARDRFDRYAPLEETMLAESKLMCRCVPWMFSRDSAPV